MRLEYVRVPFEAFSSAVSLIDNSTGMDETSCTGICTRKSSLHLSASYRRSSTSQMPVGEDLMLSLSLSMQTAAWLTTVGGRRRRKSWKAGRARVACASRMGVNCCQGSQRGVAAPATLFRTSPPWTRRRPKLWAFARRTANEARTGCANHQNLPRLQILNRPHASNTSTSAI